MGFSPTLFASAREQGGARAKHAGKEFEQLILASQQDAKGPVCVLHQIKNFAKRIPEHDRRLIEFGQRMRLVEEKSQFDFTGEVWGSGISIHFDAKSCGSDAASFRVTDPKIVKPHQIAALQRSEAAGAFSGFLVRSLRAQKYLWLWASKARRSTPIRWDDPAWDVLGPITLGRGVPLRKLFEGYQ